MVFVIFPMYLLLLMAVIALASGLIWSYETRRSLPAALSLGHAALIFGLFYAQASVLYWTID